MSDAEKITKKSHSIAVDACLAAVRVQENIKDLFDGKMSLDAMTAANAENVAVIDKLRAFIDEAEKDLEEARRHIMVMASVAQYEKREDDNASVFINVSRCREALEFATRKGWIES